VFAVVFVIQLNHSMQDIQKTYTSLKLLTLPS